MRLAALFQIALMIFLRAPKFSCWFDLRNDGPIEVTAHAALRFFRRRFLLGRMIKNHGTVLRPNVRALAIQRRRIVVRPENVEKFVIPDLRWVEFDLNNFRVAGFIRANVFISWVLFGSAGVADRGRSYTFQFPESFFYAPKTPRAERRFLSCHAVR
jgi:hypothetical protein